MSPWPRLWRNTWFHSCLKLWNGWSTWRQWTKENDANLWFRRYGNSPNLKSWSVMMMLQRKLEECIDSMWETFGEDTENHKVLLKTDRQIILFNIWKNQISGGGEWPQGLRVILPLETQSNCTDETQVQLLKRRLKVYKFHIDLHISTKTVQTYP